MFRVANLLILVSNAIAGAALTAALMRFAAWPDAVSVLAGLVLFVLLTQFFASLSGSAENRHLRKELAELSALTAGLSRDLEIAEDRLLELTDWIETESKTRNEELVAEMKVIEGLVKRLAEPQRAERTKQALLQAPVPSALGDDRYEAGENRSDAYASDGPVPVADMSDAELLESIRHALEENRVDLFLQPIVTLPQRKVRFYEGLSRLRTPGGETIMPHDYMRVAGPAGMMPAVDNLLLFRCIQVVRRLSVRNRDLGLFCNISANSLRDSDFFPQFIDYMEHNRELANHLVFEFSQSTIDECGPVENAGLEALARLGFKFSMDRVKSLRINFADLHNRNFHYIKISAETLLTGGRDAGADIHAGDLKELMRRNGLDLIVDKIETERQVVDILDFDVDYGQGYLFGEPKPMRDDQLQTVSSAA